MKQYSFSFNDIHFSNLKSLIESFNINSLYQFISSEYPFPQTVEKSLQFLSRSYSELLKEQFDQSLSVIIQNFDLISFDDLNKLSNSHLLKIFSSENFQIENEDSLFQLIMKMIEENKNRMILLQTLHFEFASSEFINDK
jgi:hypothetical protein